MNEETTNVGVKWGLILGGILVAYTIVLYSIDMSLMIGGITQYLPILFVIAIGFLVAKSYKETHKGFGSFGDIFKQLLITFAIGVAISLTVKFVLFNFIDTDAADQLMELSIEKASAMMEKMGIEMPEEAMEAMEEKNPFTLSSIITSFATVTFGNILFGLMIAGITKKEENTFE